MTEDITASISGFRTVRTLNFHSRAKAMDVGKTDKKAEKLLKSGKQPSEPSETILPPDQAAWLPVARQILGGEFGGADRSTCESLAIGLRSIGHPLCQQALARLVLAGEFDGCDRAMRESLTIGLRSIRHPDCQRALERLNTENRQP